MGTYFIAITIQCMFIVYIRQSTEVVHSRKVCLMALVQDDFTALLSEAMHFSGSQPLLKCDCLGCGACSLKKKSARWLSKIHFTLYIASGLWNSNVAQSKCKGTNLGDVKDSSASLNMHWTVCPVGCIECGCWLMTVQGLPFIFFFTGLPGSDRSSEYNLPLLWLPQSMAEPVWSPQRRGIH